MNSNADSEDVLRVGGFYMLLDLTLTFNVSFDEFKALAANCTNEGNEKATVYLVSK